MNKELFYFGFRRGGGHYWYGSEYALQKSFPDVQPSVFKYIDNTYPPREAQEGVYREVNIGSARILAWKDYSGDKRPGSNSVLVGKGYATSDEMIADAHKQFPEVMNRQTKKLTHESV